MILGFDKKRIPKITPLRVPSVRVFKNGYLSLLIFDRKEYTRLMNLRIKLMKLDAEFRLRRKLEINLLEGTRGNIELIF